MSFHKKIFFVILIVHLTIGTLSVFLVNNIINEALSIGINPAVKSYIENIYDASKEEITTRKKLYDYICRDVLSEIIQSTDFGDKDRVKRIVLRNISRYADLFSIYINNEEIELLKKEFSEKGTYYISDQRHNNLEFKCKFSVPEIVISNQSSLLKIISIHDSISGIKNNLSKLYLKAYVVMFGISFVTIMVLGYVFIGAFLSPIRELKAGIRRIKNNIFDQPIQVSTKDEMGELASEINRLANELKVARERESYLERIGSYQEVAKRIAHEIKNPLTPIRLAFQEVIARYKGNDQSYKELLNRSYEIVEDEIKTLSKIIDQFKEFAKMPVAVREPVKIDEYIRDIVNSSSYLNDQIKIELHLSSPNAVVQIDKLMMKKVFENLIQNAIEANAKRMVISSFLKGDFYIIRFEDDGIGIDEKIQDVIFEPYFTTKDYGTGLGLSLTKKAILEHYGKITLDREYKNGCAFVIELPLAD